MLPVVPEAVTAIVKDEVPGEVTKDAKEVPVGTIEGEPYIHGVPDHSKDLNVCPSKVKSDPPDPSLDNKHSEDKSNVGTDEAKVVSVI